MTRNRKVTDPDEIRRRVAQHGRWWHEIELGHGIVTPGDDSNRKKLPVLEDLGLPSDLVGSRALDIGCSDGYFSFELEKRGAHVVAIDFVPPNYTGFSVAADILGSEVEYRMDNVYNLNPESYGLFDIVFFLGVLYHLRKPLSALDSIRSVMKPGSQLYLVTFMIDEHVLLPDGGVTTLAKLNPALLNIPMWQSYPGGSLNGDFTNCFAPNMCALQGALSDAQFRVEKSISLPGGGYVRATAVEDPLTAKYQKLDGRLEDSPFDPSVPYYLDEEGAVHDLTGRREDNMDPSSVDQTPSEKSSKPSLNPPDETLKWDSGSGKPELKETTLHIRQATPDDVHEIFALHVDSIRQLCHQEYSTQQIEAWTRQLEPDRYVSAMERFEFHVAVSDRIIAFVMFDIEGSELIALYCHPSATGHGVGKALVEFVESIAREHSISELKLKATLNAVSFYESCGFSRGENTCHPLPDGPDLPCIAMTKSLVF